MTADLADELSWAGEEALPDLDLGGAMRSALREEYAWASDEEMQDALDNVLDAMSPAEGFNFGAALSQIGRSLIAKLPVEADLGKLVEQRVELARVERVAQLAD